MAKNAWELYENIGYETAIAELDSAMREAISAMFEHVKAGNLKWSDEDKVSRAAWIGFKNFVWPVMMKHKCYGATDTEPMAHAESLMKAALRKHFDIDWQPWGRWF